MKKLIAIGMLIIVATVCLKSPERKNDSKAPQVLSQKSQKAETYSESVKTSTVEEAKIETVKEVSFTELEHDFRNLSLKELDERIAAIEKSEELRTFIFNANKGSLGEEESKSLVNLIRTKAVLSKLAAEKELGEVL